MIRMRMLVLLRRCGDGRRYASSLVQAPPRPTRGQDAAPAAAPVVLSVAAPPYELREGEIHCVLGVNGSGKSRLLQRLQLASAADPARSPPPRVASLSLDAHRAFVAQHGPSIVANVLGGVGSPSARDLLVRLGLFPVWDSHVHHLSTGELRKLMLAVTLLRTPRVGVLLLDQPFDGLDVSARRQLEWMLGQLTHGFTRLLVDTGGRNEAFAYKTQVLLVANRLEHVIPEIVTHVVLTKKKQHEQQPEEKTSDEWAATTDVEIRKWSDREQPERMLREIHDFLAVQASEMHPPAMSEAQEEAEIEGLVTRIFDCSMDLPPTQSSGRRDHVPTVALRHVSIAYGNRLLLEDVEFHRHRHEHWALLGPNGSGKSSLMRVLTQTDGHGQVAGEVVVHGERIAVVSTDQHVEMLSRPGWASRSAQDWLESANYDHADGIIEAVVDLLRLPRAVLSRAFGELSQGEQKLVQIATAVMARPQVLILDEVTHGLDLWNRARVLKVINGLGTHAASKTHLILITHHEEEIVKCFTGVFEIQDQQLVERL